MKYLGTHKNNEDLVPKSYIDEKIKQVGGLTKTDIEQIIIGDSGDGLTAEGSTKTREMVYKIVYAILEAQGLLGGSQSVSSGGGQTQYAHFAVCDKYEYPREEIEYEEEIFGKNREKRQIFTFHGGKKYDVKIIDTYMGLEESKERTLWVVSRDLRAYYKDGVYDFTSEPDNFTLTYENYSELDNYIITFYLIREDLPPVCEGFMLLKDAPILNKGKQLGIQVTSNPTASKEPSEYKWLIKQN